MYVTDERGAEASKLSLLKGAFIEFLVSSGQLDFNQANYPIPRIVLEAQAMDPEGGVEKPPFKLRTALEDEEELTRMSRFITSWMAMECIPIPNYIGGPSNKAIPLGVATAMELSRYNHNGDIGFLFDKKDGDPVDTAQLLRESGAEIVRTDDMDKPLTAKKVTGFAKERTAWIRGSRRYVNAVAGDGMGIAGATAVLKTLYDETTRDGYADKKFWYGQRRDRLPAIKGDVKHGDGVFLVRYPHGDAGGFYGDTTATGELLVLDDSAVSYRSLIRYMEKLRSVNQGLNIKDIMVPIVIDEFDWMREDFDDYARREWNGSNSGIRLHVLATSREIIDYVHRKRLSVGGRDLVDNATYENAQRYFKRMKGLGEKPGYLGTFSSSRRSWTGTTSVLQI